MADKREKKKSGFTEKDQPFLVRVRECFLAAKTAEEANRREMAIDRQFKNLEQWDSAAKTEREQSGRPCLTIDQLGEPIRQVCNQQRHARPSLQVSPVDEGADEETAEIFQGLIRHIENGPKKGSLADDWAFEEAVSFGLGWSEIRTAYTSPTSHDQDIQIVRVLNTDAIYVDPAVQQPDYSDMRWLIQIEDIPTSEYKRRYPKSELASLDDFTDVGTELPDWFPEKTVRVAKYWYLEYEHSELKDGEDVRDVETPVVKWAIVNGCEIIAGNKGKTEGEVWAGSMIPLTPMLGEELYIKGKRVLRGIIRAGRDPQKAYNFERTALTEMTALAKTAPWLAEADQYADYEKIWAEQTTSNVIVLPYKARSVDGTLIPPPQRIISNPPIEATVVGINLAKQDLRSTTGWYDPTDPSRKNTDQSGRAILARKEAAASGNAHYLDNFATYKKRQGDILIDLIPKIYNQPGRIIRILGDEDQSKTVMLNQPFMMQGGKPQAIPEGQQVGQGMRQFFQLDTGRYDVEVGVGTNYLTKQQETADNGLRLMEVLGDKAGLIADLVVDRMDWPGSTQMAERLKKLLPPELQDEGEDGQQIPPQIQQKLAQLTEENKGLQAALQEAARRIDTDQVKQEATLKKAQIDASMDQQKLEVEREKAQIDASMDEQKLQVEREKIQASIYIAELNASVKGYVTQHQTQHEEAATGRQYDHERRMAAADASRDEDVLGQEQEFSDQQARTGAQESASQADRDRAFQASQAAEDRAMQPTEGAEA